MSLSISISSTAVTIKAPWRRRTSRKISPRCFIPTTRDRGQATTPGAAILFRLLRAAGYDPHPPACRRALDKFHEKWAIQLNDTHPSIGVAELMRLADGRTRTRLGAGLGVTSQTFNYTNHTLLPEALGALAVALFASLLPRHIEIIYEINSRFLKAVREQFRATMGR